MITVMGALAVNSLEADNILMVVGLQYLELYPGFFWSTTLHCRLIMEQEQRSGAQQIFPQKEHV